MLHVFEYFYIFFGLFSGSKRLGTSRVRQKMGVFEDHHVAFGVMLQEVSFIVDLIQLVLSYIYPIDGAPHIRSIVKRFSQRGVDFDCCCPIESSQTHTNVPFNLFIMSPYAHYIVRLKKLPKNESSLPYSRFLA